ncbi:MAG: HD domain-containing protein [Chromatiales bacterium]|nr:HD domain-containing protein [Chromatiales bacterium]
MRINEQDEVLMREFLAELDDTYRQVEKAIIALERDATSTGSLSQAYRLVLSIKGNLQLMQLTCYADVIYGIENIFDSLRRGKIVYSSIVADLLLLTLNEVVEMCRETCNSGKVNKRRCSDLYGALKQVVAAKPDKLDSVVKKTVSMITPELSREKMKGAGSNDLQLFREFARQQQTRSSYWEGRAERLWELAQLINQASGECVKEDQLQAAIYLHDMGMAFLPLELLHTSQTLNEEERKRLYLHPQVAAVLLRQLGGWSDAAKMAEQHHEWYDGSGYPKGIEGSAICDGAKIIAIVDAFESMTHERSDREHRCSALRAVAEISEMAGRQFDPEWVNVFRTVVQHREHARG